VRHADQDQQSRTGDLPDDGVGHADRGSAYSLHDHPHARLSSLRIPDGNVGSHYTQPVSAATPYVLAAITVLIAIALIVLVVRLLMPAKNRKHPPGE